MIKFACQINDWEVFELRDTQFHFLGFTEDDIASTAVRVPLTHGQQPIIVDAVHPAILFIQKIAGLPGAPGMFKDLPISGIAPREKDLEDAWRLFRHRQRQGFDRGWNDIIEHGRRNIHDETRREEANQVLLEFIQSSR